MATMIYFSNSVDPETGDLRCRRCEVEFDPTQIKRYFPAMGPDVNDPTLAAFYEPKQEDSHEETILESL